MALRQGGQGSEEDAWSGVVHVSLGKLSSCKFQGRSWTFIDLNEISCKNKATCWVSNFSVLKPLLLNTKPTHPSPKHPTKPLTKTPRKAPNEHRAPPRLAPWSSLRRFAPSQPSRGDRDPTSAGSSRSPGANRTSLDAKCNALEERHIWWKRKGGKGWGCCGVLLGVLRCQDFYLDAIIADLRKQIVGLIECHWSKNKSLIHWLVATTGRQTTSLQINRRCNVWTSELFAKISLKCWKDHLLCKTPSKTTLQVAGWSCSMRLRAFQGWSCSSRCSRKRRRRKGSHKPPLVGCRLLVWT